MFLRKRQPGPCLARSCTIEQQHPGEWDLMARSDLLLTLVQAGTSGDTRLFRAAAEAVIAEERTKQHHVLADALSNALRQLPLVVSQNGAVATRHLFFETVPRVKLDDLVLPDSVRVACCRLVEEQHRKDLLRSYNLEPRHRILIVGPPGTGKTSLAEALASELMVSFITVRYEALIASYLGETGSRLKSLFDQIRTHNCVLFFDEFDTVGKERGDVHETGEIKRVVSSLLLQIDALPSHVVVVTATNHPELLDRAVWRRFQLRLTLPLPAEKQIYEWLRRAEKDTMVRFASRIDSAAQVLKGRSFAELSDFVSDLKRRIVLRGNEIRPTLLLDELVEERRDWKQQRHRSR